MPEGNKKEKVFPLQLVVIGSGGTGTYFLKEVSRYLAGLGKKSPFKDYSIYDGDIVEKKNLDRQCFTSDDIGQNKACVMAEILTDAFDIPWKSYPFYVTKMRDIRLNKDYIPVVIGSVDNHACRMVMEELFHTLDCIFYLDSANEYSSGEVVFSAKLNGKLVSPLRSYYFPEIKKPEKARTEMSCTELNLAAPQHIKTNMAAGNILLGEVTAICDGHFHGGMVCFDTERYYQEFIPYVAKAPSKEVS